MTLMILLMMAAAQVVPGGPAGPVMSIDPAGGASPRMAVSYAPELDLYLIAHVNESELRLTLLDPETGSMSVTDTIDMVPSKVLLCWYPPTRRFLMMFAWSAEYPASPPPVQGRWVGEQGTLDSDFFLIGLTNIASMPHGLQPWTYYAEGEVSVASNGESLLVTWRYFKAVIAPAGENKYFDGTLARYIRPGSAMREPVELGSDSLYDMKVAALGPGSDYFAGGWTGSGFSGFVCSGTSLDPSMVSELQDYAVGGSPALVPCPDRLEYLLAWCEADGEGRYEPFAMTIDPAGNPITAPTRLASDPTRMAWGSTASWNPIAREYMVSWFEGAYAEEAPHWVAPYDIRGVRLAGEGLSPIEGDLRIADPGCSGDRSPALLSAARTRVPETLTIWLNDAPDSGDTIEARSWRIPTLQLKQRLPADLSTMAQGATVLRGEIIAEIEAESCWRDVPLTVEIEIAEEGQPFREAATLPATVIPQDSFLRILVDGLRHGTGYRWRARVINPADGSGSGWLAPFPAGAVPDFRVRSNVLPIASSPRQVRQIDGIALSPGSMLPTPPIVRFEAGTQDADGDEVRLEVELCAVGESFLGRPTLQGGWTLPGQTATAGFALAREGEYRWRYRVVDETLMEASWLEFGGNSSESTDFIAPIHGSFNGASGCLASASMPAGLSAFLALLLTVATCKRDRRRPRPEGSRAPSLGPRSGSR